MTANHRIDTPRPRASHHADQHEPARRDWHLAWFAAFPIIVCIFSIVCVVTW